jgi:hypothetical protein
MLPFFKEVNILFKEVLAPLVPKVSWITNSNPSAMELGVGGTFRMCHLV